MRRVAASVALLVACGCGGKPRGPGTAGAPRSPAQSTAHAPKTPTSPHDSRLPGSSGPVRFTPPVPERFELKNGVPVYYHPQGATPLVVLALVVPRGAATDPPDKAGLTALTVDLLDEGAGARSAIELNDELGRLGTDFAAEVEVDAAVLSMNLLAENFEPSLAILADIVQRPSLLRGEFLRRKSLSIAAAIQNESEPIHARELVVRRVLFGSGYGGAWPAGTRSTLEAIDYRDVMRHYRAFVAPEGAAFVVAGGIERENVRPALERAFGGWEGTPTPAKPAAVEPGAIEHALHWIEYPAAPQSALAVVVRAGSIHSPEYFPALVFNRSFGDAFGSRLNLNLREAKGYTYGARSSFVRWDKAGYFGLFASVFARATGPSIDEMLNELEELCRTRPLDQSERNSAQEGLLLALPGRFERTSDTASELALLSRYRRPVDWYLRWPERVLAVDHSAANNVARKYCDPRSYAIVVAGDRLSLESPERPVVVYDKQGRRTRPVP